MKLYLDVDGVINARQPPWPERKSAVIEGMKIRWAPGMVSALRELDLDLTWLTSWGDMAKSRLAPTIGYGRTAPLGAYPPFRWHTTMEWKAPAMKELEPNRDASFIWIDDEIHDYAAWEFGMPAHKWFPCALIISPAPSTGITPEHITQIREYKERHEE